MSTERLVALDIGTRSVIGIVLEKSEHYKIVAIAIEEHNQRSMFDGQIHDIPKVAFTVSNVINSLQEQTGETISEVSVAAAGRSLITIKASSKLEHDLRRIEQDEIVALELQAVQTAHKQLSGDDTIKGEYHCVGYTVLNYYLDGNVIGNLINQTGRIAEVEVIATFLPRVVVDSLIAVLDKCNLKIKSLTLEPMAAAELAIPEGMRQLNLALVDIGAGTSDIAITANGRLVAYGMVPCAGDEITDKIAENYILDFATAEKVKRELNKKTVKFKDILGKVHTGVPTEQIKMAIAETTDALAQKISNTILDLNSKPPQAVICIGGGSLTPGIVEKIATALDMPTSRVGIAGRSTLQDIVGLNKNIFKQVSAEQLITPLGIGINSFMNPCLTYCEVYINDKITRLLAIKELTVGDALIAAGIDLRKLIGRPGRALSLEINGEVTFFRGKPGQAAKIMLNEKVVNVNDPIFHGDHLTFLPAVDGEDCQLFLSDLLKLNTIEITLNGEELLVEPRIYINDQVVSKETKIEDNSKVTIIPLKVKDVLNKAGYDIKNIGQIKINDTEVSLESSVKNGDKLEVVHQPKKTLTQQTIQVTVNNQPVNLKWDKVTQPILSDLLPFVNIDLTNNANNKRLIMKVNGLEAGFTTEIKTHDQIQLYWE